MALIHYNTELLLLIYLTSANIKGFALCVDSPAHFDEVLTTLFNPCSICGHKTQAFNVEQATTPHATSHTAATRSPGGWAARKECARPAGHQLKIIYIFYKEAAGNFVAIKMYSKRLFQKILYQKQHFSWDQNSAACFPSYQKYSCKCHL